MTAEDYFLSLMLANEPLTDIVGDRVYPVQPPQAATHPYIVFFKGSFSSASGSRSYAGLDSVVRMERSEIVIEVHAKGAAICYQIRNILSDMLNYNGTITKHEDQQEEIPDQIGYFLGRQLYSIYQSRSA